MNRFAWWRRRRHDGVVIETRLKARLFGAPVLRVDGTVLVSPGRIVDLPTRRVVDDDHEVVASTNGTSERTASIRAPGEDLARAAQLIADTDGSIARRQRS